MVLLGTLLFIETAPIVCPRELVEAVCKRAVVTQSPYCMMPPFVARRLWDHQTWWRTTVIWLWSREEHPPFCTKTWSYLCIYSSTYSSTWYNNKSKYLAELTFALLLCAVLPASSQKHKYKIRGLRRNCEICAQFSVKLPIQFKDRRPRPRPSMGRVEWPGIIFRYFKCINQLWQCRCQKTQNDYSFVRT